jgi:histidine triad (HIT) family protein
MGTPVSDFYCDEVLSGRTDVARVVETATVLAFKHTKPHWTHHVVVIPKAHVASLLDPALDDSVLTELLGVVRHVAAEMNAAHGGCHVVTNLGKYQESKHLHFHVGAD